MDDNSLKILCVSMSSPVYYVSTIKELRTRKTTYLSV